MRRWAVVVVSGVLAFSACSSGSTKPPGTTTTPPTTSCSPLSPAGNCYRRGEFCPGYLHGQTIEGDIGEGGIGPLTCAQDTNDRYWHFV